MKKKSFITLGVVAAMGVTVLAGCSGDTTKDLEISVPANAKELSEAVIANFENVVSSTGEMKEKLSGTINLMGQSIEADINANIDFKNYSEGDDQIGYTKMSSVSVLKGLEAIVEDAGDTVQSATAEVYMTGNKSDGKYTTYTKTDDTDWTVLETSVSTDLLDGQYSLYKEIVDGNVEATLSDEIEKVNGKDAYKMESTIKGELIQKILGETDMTSMMDTDALGLNDLSIPVTIYIYKDQKLPAKFELDAKEFGEKLFGVLAGLAATDESSNSTQLDEFSIETTFDNYNTVKKFEVPKEALNAAPTTTAETETASEDVTEVTTDTTTAETTTEEVTESAV